VVDIVTAPDRHTMPTGKITEVLGSHLDPGMEIDIAIRNHGIPNQWPPEVTKQCGGIADEVTEKDKQHRVDLRHLPFVTIDGEDARDFDDAVYCTPGRMGAHTLYVAIADVSHYVDVGSPLDKEAWERGNSVYFPEQVVPMLPEKLSNGLCSLNPQVDRLAMVCEMKINASGAVSKYQFYEALIHSHARLTYTQVAQMIAQRGDRDSPARQRFKFVVKHIDHLYNLFQILLAARSQRGAIDFET
ncbi:MAG: RNB domain-containing ribonuclease, partial [Porticoccaceae bacterium]|nr:RNB domain-containing ribonuclease [Porticoccaceae bacterium]